MVELSVVSLLGYPVLVDNEGHAILVGVAGRGVGRVIMGLAGVHRWWKLTVMH